MAFISQNTPALKKMGGGMIVGHTARPVTRWVGACRQCRIRPQKRVTGRHRWQWHSKAKREVSEWKEEDAEEDDEFIVDEDDEGLDTVNPGVKLNGAPFGEAALLVVEETLTSFQWAEIYALQASPPQKSISLLVEKVTDKYGSPNIDEIEEIARQLNENLDIATADGKIEGTISASVSSPGAERPLRIPEDLLRFSDLPMVVDYDETVEQNSEKAKRKCRILALESFDTDSNRTIWRLADVKQNRIQKGRPLTRRQKEERFDIAIDEIHILKLHLEF